MSLPVNTDSSCTWRNGEIPSSPLTRGQPIKAVGTYKSSAEYKYPLQNIYKLSSVTWQLQGHDAWPGRVKSIFSKYGTDASEIDGLITLHNFLQIFHEIRHNGYAQNWLSTTRNNEKSTTIRTYRLIKNDYWLEPHLLYVENKKAPTGIDKIEGHLPQAPHRTWSTCTTSYPTNWQVVPIL